MTRTAAAKASQAADALLGWLRDQPPPVFQRRSPPGPVPGQPAADPADRPPAAAAAGPPAAAAGAGVGTADPSPAAPAPERPAPIGDGLAAAQRRPPAPGTGVDRSGDIPLRLAHTDWLHHRLAITGPDTAMAAFRTAAAGAGVIPWHLELDRLEEDCFHLLVAPPAPQQRNLSLAGARIVAGQLRDAVARRHDLAIARVGRSRACPFDLHALVPVPETILRRGPDDAESLAWLWQHWGTTRELRHVTAETAVAGLEPRRPPAAGGGEMRLSFWSADWSPWRALARIEAGFPALRFALCPEYDPP